MTAVCTDMWQSPQLSTRKPQHVEWIARSSSNNKAAGHLLCANAVADRLRRHLDRMAGTLFVADGAPCAQVELDAIEPPWPELDDRLLGTCREAVVALEAVAAREASGRFVAS